MIRQPGLRAPTARSLARSAIIIAKPNPPRNWKVCVTLASLSFRSLSATTSFKGGDRQRVGSTQRQHLRGSGFDGSQVITGW